MYKLRFRQVHLDFHTSPAIERIGDKFDAAQWQEALKVAHVDSITCFSKCHHGWSYHPTKVGYQHPHLKFDLLRAQMDAAKAIGVNVPIYLSAGVDNVMSVEHPEWREVGPDGRYTGWAQNIIDAGFHKMCFHSPYLDFLCEQIREAVELFDDCNGVLLDIISHGECCCKWCLAVMEEQGLDATKSEDRRKCAELALERYYRETTAACKSGRDDMPVFHNSGHIDRSKPELLTKYFSHLELESLPTGGWGYDHFPMSAKFVKQLPLDFLGMTGKFHTTWGEFGGYKHPNALRYECAMMLALGSKCSIGDQLHPEGQMDMSTYRAIGAAYGEVEAKEPWCDDVTSVADIGLLSSQAVNATGGRGSDADTGAGRILLEGQFLFDVIGPDTDFAGYKLLVLPDDVRVGEALKAKLDAYLAAGGKMLLTGQSGLAGDGSGFLFDIGANWQGTSEFQPDYVLPVEALRASFVDDPLVMYLPSQRIKATTGESLGDVHEPYFNRTFKHFCSHQHAPARPETSGYHCGVRNGNIMYLAHPVFTLYAGYGAVAYQHYAINAIRRLLGEPSATVNLPSTGRVTLMDQTAQSRYVLHLLHANTIARGGKLSLSGGTCEAAGFSLEVVEELLPVNGVDVELRLPRKVAGVTLQPQGQAIEFAQEDGVVKLCVDEFTCHQMVVLDYEQ